MLVGACCICRLSLVVSLSVVFVGVRRLVGRRWSSLRRCFVAWPVSGRSLSPIVRACCKVAWCVCCVCLLACGLYGISPPWPS